jgi:hypothetical protein
VLDLDNNRVAVVWSRFGYAASQLGTARFVICGPDGNELATVMQDRATGPFTITVDGEVIGTFRRGELRDSAERIVATYQRKTGFLSQKFRYTLTIFAGIRDPSRSLALATPLMSSIADGGGVIHGR